jgi:hypothetical protein
MARYAQLAGVYAIQDCCDTVCVDKVPHQPGGGATYAEQAAARRERRHSVAGSDGVVHCWRLHDGVLRSAEPQVTRQCWRRHVQSAPQHPCTDVYQILVNICKQCSCPALRLRTSLTGWCISCSKLNGCCMRRFIIANHRVESRWGRGIKRRWQSIQPAEQLVVSGHRQGKKEVGKTPQKAPRR